MLGRRVVLVTMILSLVVAGVHGEAVVSSEAGETAEDGARVNVTSADGLDDRSVWTRTYLDGLRSEGNQSFFGATRMEDGYLLVGSVESYVGTSDGDVDSYVVETDGSGQRTWGRGYLTAGTHHRVFHDGAKVGERRYLWAGTVNGDSRFETGNYWLFESDRQVRKWDIRTGDGGFYEILPAANEGYVVVGSGLTVAIENDHSGSLRWHYEGLPSTRVLGGTVAEDGVVVAGSRLREGRDPSRAGYAAKLDGDGEVVWRRNYARERAARFRAATSLADGGYVFAGDLGPPGKRQPFIVRTDETGTEQWARQPLAGVGTIHAVTSGPDGRVVAVGRSERFGGILLVYDDAGARLSVQSYGEHLRDVIRAGNNTYLAVGATEGDDTDAFATRVDLTPPRASLSIDADVAEVNETAVRLSANGSVDNYGLQAYRWDFDGDGTVDTVTNRAWTTYRFRAPGTVRPTVRVVDEAGSTAMVEAGEPIDVVDTTAPEAELREPANGVAATTAPTTLDAGSSRDNHRIERFYWDFDGDGEIDSESSSPTIRHNFSAASGVYTVGLTVEDRSGNRNSTTESIRIRDNDTPRLQVTRSVESGRDGTEPYVAELSATVSDDVGSTTVTWHLPNGTTVSGRDVTVPLTQATTSIRAVVTDEYGAQSSETISVARPEDPQTDPANSGGGGIGFIDWLWYIFLL